MTEKKHGIFYSGESPDDYRRIMGKVIEHINYDFALLRDDRYPPAFKHDSTALAGLFALLALCKEIPAKTIPKQQVEGWREFYNSWFEAKKFRSEKAKKYKVIINEVFDELLQYTSMHVPPHMWRENENNIY